MEIYSFIFKCLALFSILSLSNANAQTNCSFNPSQYEGYENVNLAIGINVTDLNQSAQLVLECGYHNENDHQNIAPSQGSETWTLYQLDCGYGNDGTYIASAHIDFVDDSMLECTNTASVVINSLRARIASITAPSPIARDTVVAVEVNVSNMWWFPISNLVLNLTDLPDNKEIGAGFKFNLAGSETKSFVFQWNTSLSTIGNHTLNATVKLGSKSNNLAISNIQISTIPSIISIINTSNNTIAAINWTTDTPANYTITYWKKNTAQNITQSNPELKSSWGVELRELEAGAGYSYVIKVCNYVGCRISQEYTFQTVANQQATATPTSTPTPSPTIAPTSTPTPSPSLTPTPPQQTITPTQNPNTGSSGTQNSNTRPTKIIVDVGNSNNDIDEKSLEGFKESTINELKNASDLFRYNIINITSIQFRPEIIGGGKVDLYATTNSRYQLNDVDCYPSENPNSTTLAKCACTLNYSNNFARFTCTIFAQFPIKLALNYTLEIRNDEGEAGFYTVSLPLGQKASLVPKQIQLKTNQFYFYVSLFVGLMLAGYAIYHIFSKFEKAQKAEKVLEDQRKQVLEDMETLKFNYLKRNIDYNTYNKAMIYKQKQITEINTRISEIESKKAAEIKAKTQGTNNIEKTVSQNVNTNEGVENQNNKTEKLQEIKSGPNEDNQ